MAFWHLSPKAAPGRATKAAVQAEYRVNGGNQRDNGHSIWSAPPAAKAEMLSFASQKATGRVGSILLRNA